MPKRHRNSSKRDSTERLERKICKYQKILESRQDVELEVRSPVKEVNPQLAQDEINEINQQIDLGK